MYKLIDYTIIRTPALTFSLRKSYDEVIKSPYFQEALFFASDSLYQNVYNDGKKMNDKKLASLIRYINRASTRCTPFGLFAGCSISKIQYDANDTSIIINKNIHKHIRLDMSFLCKLSSFLSNDKEIQKNIIFTQNSTLYKIGEKIRFIEKNNSTFQISCVQSTKELRQILSLSRHGIKIKELISFLIQKGYDATNAQEYLDDLIKSQILIGELQPSITEKDYLFHIIKVINRENIETQNAIFVRQIYDKLKQVKKNKDYRNTCEELYNFISQSNFNINKSNLFQVDFSRSVHEIKISSQLNSDLENLINFLMKRNNINKPKQLQLFTEAFYSRYEEQEIPLLEALDPEIGLGYPIHSNTDYISPILKGFTLPIKVPNEQFVKMDLFHFKLSEKIFKATEYNKHVYLTNEDFLSTSTKITQLPPLIGLMCELTKDNNNTHIYLKSAGAGCGVNLISRFAYMDKRIEDLIYNTCKIEQELNPDTIFAEISYLPEEKIGNILCHPHIRDYEIIFLTSSDIPQNQQISLSDLTISYRNGNLQLRSKKLKKNIIPKLTTAYNFYNCNMPAYRFLCDMQMQQPNIYSPIINLDVLFSVHNFIPRIIYNKNIILSLATWNIQISEIKSFFKIKDSDKLLQGLRQWRDSLKIPQYCQLKDGDNNLFIDWNDFRTIQSLFSIIKNRHNIYISEFLFTPQNAVVKDNFGNPYLNECIFLYQKK